MRRKIKETKKVEKFIVHDSSNISEDEVSDDIRSWCKTCRGVARHLEVLEFNLDEEINATTAQVKKGLGFVIKALRETYMLKTKGKVVSKTSCLVMYGERDRTSKALGDLARGLWREEVCKKV